MSRCKYIENLNKLLQEWGFSFTNKQITKNIQWHKHKINMTLAAQTLSALVASAIDFLRDELSSPQFQDIEATTNFLSTIIWHFT